MYDYIIVGAGSAGCVLANRLSARPECSVLLIEAGKRDWSPLVHIPAGLLPIMMKGLYQWPYMTDPQKHMDGRVLFSPRGKLLGGSSSINGMTYSRGMPQDYDNWSELGNVGWSYAEVLPYFKRSETYEPLTSDEAYHGKDGPLRVSRPGISGPLAEAWLEAGRQAGFPVTDDHTGRKFEGFTPIDLTVSNGRRSSASASYLAPVRSRRNLTVMTESHASRVLFEHNRAVGVEYVQGKKILKAYAACEIILCGGAVASPQLLMLSGIGESSHLREHGIKPLLDSKGVGQNLQDHVAVSVQQACSQPVGLYNYMQPFKGLRAMARYLFLRSGPLAKVGTEALAFIKSEASVDLPELQYHFVTMLYQDNGRKLLDQHGFHAYQNIMRPTSIGEIRLRSNDPFVAPRLDPNFLATEHDRRIMREGVRLARELFAQSAFDAFRGAELAPGAGVRSDADIDAFVRAKGEAYYHTVGTCKMGVDELAVVDPHLRVHGIDGLRVVDASVMPRIISGNPNMTVIMIAEKAADMICGGASKREPVVRRENEV